MAYEFSAVGWKDFDDVPQDGPPSDIDSTYAIWVEYQNPDDPEDYGRFWAYTFYGEFEDWSEWWVYIGGIMEMYGLDLAA